MLFCQPNRTFSCSRVLLFPCSPHRTMVKNVVKSEYRMIVMWSWFWGGRSAQKSLRRQKRKMPSAEKKHTNSYMWSTIWKEMITRPKIFASGQTCGQVRKMGLFNPRSREEQARYIYCGNTRFREDLRENKRKSEVRLNLRFWSDVTCVGAANAAWTRLSP